MKLLLDFLIEAPSKTSSAELMDAALTLTRDKLEEAWTPNKEDLDSMLRDTLKLTSRQWMKKWPVGDYEQYKEMAQQRGMGYGPPNPALMHRTGNPHLVQEGYKGNFEWNEVKAGYYLYRNPQRNDDTWYYLGKTPNSGFLTTLRPQDVIDYGALPLKPGEKRMVDIYYLNGEIVQIQSALTSPENRGTKVGTLKESTSSDFEWYTVNTKNGKKAWTLDGEHGIHDAQANIVLTDGKYVWTVDFNGRIDIQVEGSALTLRGAQMAAELKIQKGPTVDDTTAFAKKMALNEAVSIMDAGWLKSLDRWLKNFGTPSEEGKKEQRAAIIAYVEKNPEFLQHGYGWDRISLMAQREIYGWNGPVWSGKGKKPLNESTEGPWYIINDNEDCGVFYVNRNSGKKRPMDFRHKQDAEAQVKALNKEGGLYEYRLTTEKPTTFENGRQGYRE